jgi:hypothetical protein
MKLFTSKDLEEGKSLDSDMWYMNIEYVGSPYEAFTDIPFISNAQSKTISNESNAIAVFNSEEEALDAFSRIENNEFRINKPNIILTYQGKIINTF